MSMGPMGAMRGGGVPPQKSKDLRATLHRLLERLRPERTKLAMAIGLGSRRSPSWCPDRDPRQRDPTCSFDGLIGARLKPGTTKAQAIAMLRREGHSQIASMIGGMKLTPGIGVNIDDLGLVLGLAALVYLLARASATSRASRWPGSPACDVRPAARRRGETQSIAVALFRQSSPR